MRGVVLCEFSGTVSAAFRARGFECWSCDILPTEGDANWHIVGDAVSVAWGYNWDFAIMHPPCTDTAVSGARHFAAKVADGRQQRSLGFIKAMWNAPIRHKALEQPVSITGRVLGRTADQVLQPWEYGHGETKATCLWLHNLPKLRPTNIVEGREARVHRMAPSPDRWKERSRTFAGIAEAMADQWGSYLLNTNPGQTAFGQSNLPPAGRKPDGRSEDRGARHFVGCSSHG
jgi:hypothetical protein